VDAAREAIEREARTSYGRLLAFLATRTHDVASAEDALADAFQSALETWPVSGVPRKPEAWLLTTARRRLIDAGRHAAVAEAALPALSQAAEAATAVTLANAGFPDERLALMFICAHPEIEANIRTPLMLQVVLGLDAARIASAFLVKPSAMGQRLARAKARLREAALAFEVPEAGELAPRLNAVLEAIYAAYGSGWEDVQGADEQQAGLAGEAIMLGRLLLQLLPRQPEVQGLLALMLHCEARRGARRTTDGRYVTLSEQDPACWSLTLIVEAEAMLLEAAAAQSPGRFQLEAAIQSAHAQRGFGRPVVPEVVALLYEALSRLAPTTGVFVARAAAIAQARGPAEGWAHLAELPADSVTDYQPYWALAGALLAQLGRTPEATAAFERAIGLCEDRGRRAYLQAQLPVEGRPGKSDSV
jgi:predicted RNA polymerase sigma factor